MAIKINPDILVGDTGNVINNSDILEWSHNPGASNGSYIKFNNGLLICYKNITGTSSTPSAWANGIYFTDITVGNWAYTFKSIGNVQVTNAGNQWWANIRNVNETSCGIVRLIRPDSNSQTYNIQLFAIGTWK